VKQIAGRPHPFDSHANDAVHDHILSRVREATTGIAYVHIVDDIVSNATYHYGADEEEDASTKKKPVAVYQEGNNILVKVDGREPSLEAVLFSAHFDSVSTGSGATDDGMGVATLLQLVEYFAKNQPKRTVIFNINNAEEDGLNGAHV